MPGLPRTFLARVYHPGILINYSPFTPKSVSAYMMNVFTQAAQEREHEFKSLESKLKIIFRSSPRFIHFMFLFHDMHPEI